MKEIRLSDYTYTLPDDRIAKFPADGRAQSKLLVAEQGNLRHLSFGQITDVLPPQSFLFFNDTRVIPARLLFQKPTGASIEIMLLQPVFPDALIEKAMGAASPCVWACAIGNAKRWGPGQQLTLRAGDAVLTAEWVNQAQHHVKFSWTTAASFAEIIRAAGEVPLPPYLKRQAVAVDRERYQTVYARVEGAVAAPTAGLHFTPEILAALAAKGIGSDWLTLHVSAGTFQPVKVAFAAEHTMHEEQIMVNRSSLENLLNPSAFIVAVGTTSLRTLETLYWYGVKLLSAAPDPLTLRQEEPYAQTAGLPTPREAVRAVADYMDRNGLTRLTGQTALYILPGYRFQICQGLITNFHQPGSTLILLVAAFAGPAWKKIYEEALANNYRFLSYGDSSLIIP